MYYDVSIYEITIYIDVFWDDFCISGPVFLCYHLEWFCFKINISIMFLVSMMLSLFYDTCVIFPVLLICFVDGSCLLEGRVITTGIRAIRVQNLVPGKIATNTNHMTQVSIPSYCSYVGKGALELITD